MVYTSRGRADALVELEQSAAIVAGCCLQIELPSLSRMLDRLESA
ncbi:hypothetical protein [Rubidibacter lacunae]|nr:hypothetical protein [Rubidibacter lacunae]